MEAELVGGGWREIGYQYNLGLSPPKLNISVTKVGEDGDYMEKGG